MKIFAKVDRCNARRSAEVRLIGVKERTAFADRRLPFGLHARWGRLRLRLYLLGPARG